MACPYFYPGERLADSAWLVPPRLPLMDPYAGECRANCEAHRPDDELLRQACNPGYGRERCGRFPADARADAVRFHVAEDRSDLIRIQWVYEKDCWPVEHGLLEYSLATRGFLGEPGNDLLQRQAAVFVEGWIRRSRT